MTLAQRVLETRLDGPLRKVLVSDSCTVKLGKKGGGHDLGSKSA